MHIRFHRGQNVDLIVPTAQDGAYSGPFPADVVWLLTADINPIKTMNVTQNVQATDPITGKLLFDSNHQPVWETTTVTDPITGVVSTQVVTQQVPTTYSLLQNPSIFTQDDIQAVLITPATVVS